MYLTNFNKFQLINSTLLINSNSTELEIHKRTKKLHFSVLSVKQCDFALSFEEKYTTQDKVV